MISTTSVKSPTPSVFIDVAFHCRQGMQRQFRSLASRNASCLKLPVIPEIPRHDFFQHLRSFFSTISLHFHHTDTTATLTVSLRNAILCDSRTSRDYQTVHRRDANRTDLLEYEHSTLQKVVIRCLVLPSDVPEKKSPT